MRVSKNSKVLSLTHGLAIMMICLVACQQTSESTQQNQGNTTPSEETKARVQTAAILKVQPINYDPQSKSKKLEDYVDTKKVKVPTSLAGSNKWFMFEGPVLENNKVAYRLYADKRHRFDIYGKKVSDLVMDTVSWDYHNLMDWGSDILKVGNSLGIGSPGIFYRDSIYCLENWDKKEIEIISSGGQTSIVRTTFSGLSIGDQKMTIQQDWSLAFGDYFSTIDLKRLDGDLPEGMRFATGIVKHLMDINIGEKDGKFYGYNWGKQSFHKQNLGMGIISDSAYKPRSQDNELSHVIVFENGKQGVKYQFISVWADGVGKIDTESQFKLEIDRSISKLELN